MAGIKELDESALQRTWSGRSVRLAANLIRRNTVTWNGLSESRVQITSRTRCLLAIVVVTVATTLVLEVSAGSAANGSRNAATSITIAIAAEPGSLDVQQASLAEDWEPLINVYEGLTKFDAKANVVPALAVSWKNLTRKKWRFNLRSGVKFQDGESFTPAAAVYSIKRALNPATNANLGFYPTVTGAEVVPGANAIVVTTNTPDASLPRELTFLAMVPPNYAQQQSSEFLKKAVGTGPYKMVSWTPGQQVVEAANPKWWGGKPRYQKVTFKIITDSNVRVQALRSGEVNFATSIPPDSTNLVPQVYSPPSNAVCGVRLNTLSGVFKNLDARLAANYALDRQTLVKSLFGRFGKVPNGQMVSSAVFGYNPKLKDYPYNLTMAKQLLAQSGYANQPIQIATPSGKWTGDRDMVLATVQYLQKAGFNVQAQVVDYSVWVQAYKVKPHPDATFVCTSEDTFTGLKVLANLALPTGAPSAYSNPTIDKEFIQAESQFNDAKRLADLQQMWAQLKTAAMFLPIASVNQIFGAQKNVHWSSATTGLLYANDLITS